jgi:hypothetical protein
MAECACIAVEDPAALYVTKDYAVTHNTLTSRWHAQACRARWSIPGFMHTWFCVTQLRQVALL